MNFSQLLASLPFPAAMFGPQKSQATLEREDRIRKNAVRFGYDQRGNRKKFSAQERLDEIVPDWEKKAIFGGPLP